MDTASMNRLRVGIVAAGIMGEQHAKIYSRNPACEIVAIADGNLDRARILASKLNIPSVFSSHQAMLAGTEIDVVSVCTPDFAHAEPAIAAAEAGKHVLVEKPLAVTVADAEAIIAAARRNHVKVMTQFSHRWVPAYHQTKDLLAGGELGLPILAYARKNNPIFVPTEMIRWANRTTPSWFLSSHDIDLVCWWFGTEPEEVYANAVRKVLVARQIDTPDAIQAQVRFADGAVATFEACWIYPNTFPSMPDSFVEVITTGAAIHLDRKREQIEVSTAKAFQYPRNLLAYTYADGEVHGAVRLSLDHFVKCVLEDREPLITLESSLRVTRILEAIQRSIEARTPIRM
jgi:predicted dehydrogenase